MFNNATKLTVDWLKNNEGYAVPGSDTFQRTKFTDYYVSTCAYIREHHYLRLTPEQIEIYITVGEVEYDEDITLTCRITDATERADLFRSAQAKQLIYDCTAGRASMLRGEDQKTAVCPDFVDRLKMLGLYQRTPNTI